MRPIAFGDALKYENTCVLVGNVGAIAVEENVVDLTTGCRRVIKCWVGRIADVHDDITRAAVRDIRKVTGHVDAPRTIGRRIERAELA